MSRMEPLDKALSLVFQKLWASSFYVTEVFSWSEIIAPVENLGHIEREAHIFWNTRLRALSRGSILDMA